jgi:hypothetical protein
MSNRELRSLGVVEPLSVPLQASPARTVYSKTLRSGTTYAQYRDLEEEGNDKKKTKYTPHIKAEYVHLYPEERIFVEEKWTCRDGEPVERISARVLPSDLRVEALRENYDAVVKGMFASTSYKPMDLPPQPTRVAYASNLCVLPD